MKWTPQIGWCLVCSLLLHVLWVLGSERSASLLPVSPVDSRELAPAWVGETFEIDVTEGPQEDARANAGEFGSSQVQSADSEASPAEQEETQAPVKEPATAPPVSSPPRESVPAAQSPSKESERAKVQESSGASAQTFEPERGASSLSPAATGQGTTSGAYGAAGGQPGVRDLSAAFTRALPLAASKDRAWAQFLEGTWEKKQLRLELNEEGRIASSRWQNEEETSSPVLESLSKRTLALLGGGQFALPLTEGRASVQFLEIQIRIEDRPPSEEAEEFETVQIGFEPPQSNQAGEAFFQWGSGRRWSATVRVVNAK